LQTSDIRGESAIRDLGITTSNRIHYTSNTLFFPASRDFSATAWFSVQEIRSFPRMLCMLFFYVVRYRLVTQFEVWPKRLGIWFYTRR